MAERYTVAVVVVGSSPIIRPEKPLTQGLFCSDISDIPVYPLQRNRQRLIGINGKGIKTGFQGFIPKACLLSFI